MVRAKESGTQWWWKGEEIEAAGQVGDALARKACKGFPLVVHKRPKAIWGFFNCDSFLLNKITDNYTFWLSSHFLQW